MDGEPRQVVHAQLTVPIIFHDLARRDDAEDVARTLGREEAGKPFDLAAGPLLRVGLLRLDAERHVLLFTIHHIIADGVSLSVLARDLSVFTRVRAPVRLTACLLCRSDIRPTPRGKTGC